MPRDIVEFANDFYQSISTPLANRRLINMYRQVPDGPALSTAALIGCPGIDLDQSMTDLKCRGLFSTKKRGFAVYDETLYEIFDGGTNASRGTVAGENPVRWASNGFTMVIVSDTKGYFYDLTNDTLAEITDPVFSSFGTVLDVSYKDGFFVYMTEDYIFNGSVVTTNDGKDFDGLSFGSAEVEPDGNVAIITSTNQLYVGGQNTFEVFDTIGGTGFPYQRINGATIQKGALARDTVIGFRGMFCFLGGEIGEAPAMYLVLGSNYTQITTPAIENYLQGLTQAQVEACICWAYQQGGSDFLVLEAGSATFVYDHTSSEKSGRPIWHERRSGDINWTAPELGFANWRARFSMNVFGKTYVGDRTTDDLGTIGYTTYTEYGNKIPRSVITQPFGTGDRVILSELEMVAEVGVGATGTDPKLLLSYSDDQGKTYSNPIPQSLGVVGEYDTRLVWRRLGQLSRDRVLRFYTDDPVKIALLRLEAEVENG